MAFEFRLPDIGEGIHEGEIVQWLVNVGDTVKEDQPVLEVMTDKVTAEIPSPVTGVIQELRGDAGQVVKVGSVIMVVNKSEVHQSGAAASPKAPEKAKEPVAATAAISSKTAPTNGNGAKSAPAQFSMPNTSDKVLAAPATRKLARQLGVELTMITGSGPRGRITPDDVRAGGGTAIDTRPTRPEIHPDSRPLVPTRTESIPTPKAKPQPISVSQGDVRKPFAGMRKKIAEHLVKSKFTAPHFAYVEEVDMSELVKTRAALKAQAEAQGVKLTFLPFIIKAVIAGLKAYPILNSQLDETTQEIVYKGDYNIGIAVATDDGLVVPVIKHADQKSLVELAAEIKLLSDKARANKLSLDDIKGGTFTLTSIGSIGGLFGVPIINYPEVGIMGINKITPRPVVRDGEIVIRDIMHLSLSCDHRVVDGAEGAQFTKHVIEFLEVPTRLLLV